MTAQETIEPGLRERKRLATHRAIQFAAIDLVSERGLDGTTVDEISRRADVSARTFFNYFPSKEAAIIGDHPAIAEGPAVEAFISAGRDEPLMDGIARLITESLSLDSADQELMIKRKGVIGEYPHLFAMRIATMRRAEEELAAIVARRLATDDPTLAADSVGLDSRARLTANVAFATMRHAWGEWASVGGTSELAERVRISFGKLGSILA